MSFEHVRELWNAADGSQSTGGRGMVIFEFPQVDGKATCVLLQPAQGASSLQEGTPRNEFC